MSGKAWVMMAAVLAVPLAAQQNRSRIDVLQYLVDATVNPRTQSLTASAQIRFKAVDDNMASATFELHRAMNVVRVTDETGAALPSSRDAESFSLRLALPQAMARNAEKTITVTYEGRLTGNEESPIYGIKFGAITPELAYLLYPVRWFPVNEYTVDRYLMELNLTVPADFKVVTSGVGGVSKKAADFHTYSFKTTSPGFGGSVAITKDAPEKVSAEGVSTDLYFHSNKANVRPFGEEVSRVVNYMSSVFGTPPVANLTVVELEDGTPNGYSAPGIIFVSKKTASSAPSPRVLANQISRQWWGNLVSTTTRNHLWLINGWAKYSEALYIEYLNGPAALEQEVRDLYVDALTVTDAPMIQTGRLEDYSPEFWAVSGSKGAATLHMLRYIMGDKPLETLVKRVCNEFANKQINTEMFKKVAEEVAGYNLQGFFVQWVESTGAPEFKLTYTVYRTQKGFRILGKVTQDLDTFRMPVDLKIETEGNPESKRIEVVGVSSEFTLETFGKPKRLALDPEGKVLRFSDEMRVAVAIRRGEQLAEVGEYGEAMKEYQKALEVRRYSSLAHYRVAELFMLQNSYQSAANEFREALNGDLQPKWTEVWSHINLGKIFDITGQRERARNEYQQAVRTKDNTQGAQAEASKYLNEPYQRPQQNI